MRVEQNILKAEVEKEPDLKTQYKEARKKLGLYLKDKYKSDFDAAYLMANKSLKLAIDILKNICKVHKVDFDENSELLQDYYEKRQAYEDSIKKEKQG